MKNEQENNKQNDDLPPAWINDIKMLKLIRNICPSPNGGLTSVEMSTPGMPGVKLTVETWRKVDARIKMLQANEMSKHTAEPWKVSDGRYIRVRDPQSDADKHAICQVYTRGIGPERQAESDANAARIVECVNALSGLNPAGVKGMVEAATAVIDRWDSPDWKIQAPTADVMNALRTALANLKGNAAQAVIDAGGATAAESAARGEGKQ